MMIFLMILYAFDYNEEEDIIQEDEIDEDSTPFVFEHNAIDAWNDVDHDDVF